MTDSGLETRLKHFTPLRYPGGKGKLAAFVKSIIETNSLSDGEYIEPYAGGAAIALELLMQEYVSRIRINDISVPIYCFWRSVLDEPEALCRLIRDIPLTVTSWDKQRKVFAAKDGSDRLALGFATFFLNRTNRSGILNGGIIGGRDQSGPWKIDARFNPPELITRVQAIAALKSRINLTRQDAVKYLEKGVKTWPANSLVYLDPPYYEKGRELYYDFYDADDHASVAKVMLTKMKRQRWLVSYDNVADIRQLYPNSRMMTYNIGYSARSARQGSEVMFFCDKLTVPSACGSMSAVRNYTARM